MDCTARQKHESALYVFLHLDFQLVIVVTSSILHDVKLHQGFQAAQLPLGALSCYVVVNFSSQVIFIFLLFQRH